MYRNVLKERYVEVDVEKPTCFQIWEKNINKKES